MLKKAILGIQLVIKTFELITIERRLPAKLTENQFMQYFGYTRRRLENRAKPLKTEDIILVHLPHLGHRYVYQILHLFSLSNSQIVFLWDFNLKNYIRLGHEGRRLFTIKNLKIVSDTLKLPKPKIVVVEEESKNTSDITHIIVETDVSKSFNETGSETLMLPYCVHPSLLQQYESFEEKIKEYRNKKRYISVFFAGNTQYRQSRYFIEQYYHVPSRDHCVEFLLENREQLRVIEIDKFKQRKEIINNPTIYRDFSVVLCTSKGNSANWLEELATANFFLALPGWYMLMCHNIIEAMAVGCIPILSYKDWFSPALVHEKNCFTYRRLEELPEIIARINSISYGEIETMRTAVLEYFDQFLSPSKTSSFLSNYKGSKLHLFMNNEHSETLRKASHESLLYRGGSLQEQLGNKSVFEK